MTEEHFYDHFHQDRPTGPGVWLTRRFSQRVLAFAGIKKGHRVLEIGPGRGVFADLCLKEGAQYTAIEPNPYLAQALEDRGVEVIRALIPPLPQLEKTFDYIVMINLLEHMDGTHEALDLASHVRGHLAPGGAIVVCCPDYMNMGRHFFNVDFSHGYITTQRRLAQLLTSAGYARMKSCYLSGPVGGFAAVALAGVVARLPFGVFHTWCPKNRIFAKLYKIQLSLSRKVLIVGQGTA